MSHELYFPNIFEGFSHAINETFCQRCVISHVCLDTISLAEHLCQLLSNLPY